MAEVSLQRRGELMRALFDVLHTALEGMRASEAIAALRRCMPPTEYEAGEYVSGGSRYEKVVRFTTIVFVKSGWLAKEGGRWYLTDEGRDAFARHRDPEAFLRAALAGYRAWKKAQPAPPDEEVEEESATVSTIV